MPRGSPATGPLTHYRHKRFSASLSLSIPTFTLAHSELARTWSSLGYDANAQQEAKKAMDEAGNLSREKHLLVEAAFYETSRDWPKAIEPYQTLSQLLPR